MVVVGCSRVMVASVPVPCSTLAMAFLGESAWKVLTMLQKNSSLGGSSA